MDEREREGRKGVFSLSLVHTHTTTKLITDTLAHTHHEQEEHGGARVSSIYSAAALM